jgi:hypothetical protein
MVQARQANRGLPLSALFIAAALVAAMVISAMVATGTLNLTGVQVPAERGQADPALIQSGQDWERQRIDQSLNVDPVLQSGRSWQLHREQEAGTVVPPQREQESDYTHGGLQPR